MNLNVKKKNPKAIVLLDLNEDFPTSPRSQLPVTFTKQLTPSFSENLESPILLKPVPIGSPEEILVEPLSPED